MNLAISPLEGGEGGKEREKEGGGKGKRDRNRQILCVVKWHPALLLWPALAFSS